MKTDKMTPNRKRKIFRIYAGQEKGTHKLAEYADGSTGVIKLGVGVVEMWSSQYLNKVVKPLIGSVEGLIGVQQEKIKIELEALKWAGEYVPNFEPFETVETPKGFGVFLAYSNESKTTSMVEMKGEVFEVDTQIISKIKN